MAFTALFIGVAWASAVRARYALIALLVSTPFGFAHTIATTTITSGKVALLGALLGLLCTDLRALHPPKALRWPLASLLAIAAFDATSALWSHVPHAALHETGKWLEYALLALVSAALWRRDPDLRSLRMAVEWCVLGVVLVALITERFAPSSFVQIGTATFPRLAGTLDGPNQLGQFLVVAIAWLAYYALRDGVRQSQIILTVALIAIAATFSRTALASAVFAVGFLAWHHRRYASRALAPLGAATLGIFALIGVAARRAHDGSLLNFAARPNAAIHAGGVGTRAELWHAAITLWQTHPWIGIGADTFSHSLASVGLPTIRTHANNLYLESLADGGIVLLALVIAMLVTIIAMTWRRGSGVALTATLALAAVGLLDNPWYTPAVVAWWCIMIGITADSA